MTTSTFVPGLAGIPAAESAISFVDGERGVLEYRGIPIGKLAEQSTYEETAYLLLHGTLPTESELRSFERDLAAARPLGEAMKTALGALPDSGHPMNALQAAVSTLGLVHPAREVTRPGVAASTAVRLIAQLPTLTAFLFRRRTGREFVEPRGDLSHAANFLYMLRGTEASDLETRVMDTALILHADHTMNASTFTARVIASTLSDGYSVVAGALGSLFGPLHGGANEAVLDMLDRMGSIENVRRTTETMIAGKEKIMGVGHRVYKVKDPRAFILQRLAERLFEEVGASPRYELACALEAVVKEKLSAKGIYPNVDFYSGIVYDRIGIERALFTPIFAVSRVAGWCAHWLEQLGRNRIFRPRQIYTGNHDIPYVPVEERG